MKNYEFITASGDTCSFSICGEYYNRCYDIAVSCGDYYHEWEEVDAGSADEMFTDLVESGVRFESKRALVANIMTVQSVMLDGDATTYDILRKVDGMTDDEIDDKLDYYVGTVDVLA